VLFLPGLGGDADFDGSFADTLHFAANTLGWRFGGRFCFAGTDLEPRVDFDTAGQTTRSPAGIEPPSGSTVCEGLADPSASQPGGATGALSGHFFTLDFGNAFASDGSDALGGLDHQAAEVGRALTLLQEAGVSGPVALVGHGAGGLAAREYLAQSQNDAGRVAQLVTYGTPHRGADMAYWCRAAADAAASTAGGVFGTILSALATSSACAEPLTIGGVRDVAFSCGADSPDLLLSEFLSRTAPLPDSVAYTSIVGTWVASR
jgi:hypothetical protein